MAKLTLWSPTKGDIDLPIVPGANDSMDANPTKLGIDTGTKTATSSGTGATGTVTLNKLSGVITTPSLTTAAGATHTLTVTDSAIEAGDLVFASVGTAGTGTPAVASVVVSAGQVIIVVQNIHASAAFNNTLVLNFLVIKGAAFAP